MQKVDHPPRGELRRIAASAQVELAGMKSPEGLAAFLYSKKDDEEFQDALRASYRALEVAEHGDPEAVEPEPETSPDPAAAPTT